MIALATLAIAIAAALVACDIRDACNFPPREDALSHDDGDAR